MYFEVNSNKVLITGLMMETIKNLSDISALYDNYIIDIYGVIFDGEKLFPQAVKAIEKIFLLKKNIVFLSNSPRTATAIREKLVLASKTEKELNLLSKIPIFTSGDVFLNIIVDNNKYKKFLQLDNLNENLKKKRIFIVGANTKHPTVEALLKVKSVTISENIADSSCFIMLGAQKTNIPYAENFYDDILAEAATNQLFCLCPNPDQIAPDGDGQVYAAGFYADRYSKKYKKAVFYFGKPFLPAYHRIFQSIPQMSYGPILCLGDSLHHDVKGARNIGADSLFIRNGVHKNLPYDDKLLPNYVIENLQ